MLQKLLVSERFVRTRGEGGGAKGKDGVSRIPVGYLLSHITEKLRKGTFRRFKIFGYGRILCISGVFHNFPSKVF